MNKYAMNIIAVAVAILAAVASWYVFTRPAGVPIQFVQVAPTSDLVNSVGQYEEVLYCSPVGN